MRRIAAAVRSLLIIGFSVSCWVAVIYLATGGCHKH